ncbi:MAG: hypothetical protein M1828_007088 [Chrysothrix sp. TS-e1954]|nr:MAG: hypothetical protein M1828_007088 [Chrysothrix sp. TS-e1954]
MIDEAESNNSSSSLSIQERRRLQNRQAQRKFRNRKAAEQTGQFCKKSQIQSQQPPRLTESSTDNNSADNNTYGFDDESREVPHLGSFEDLTTLSNVGGQDFPIGWHDAANALEDTGDLRASLLPPTLAEPEIVPQHTGFPLSSPQKSPSPDHALHSAQLDISKSPMLHFQRPPTTITRSVLTAAKSRTALGSKTASSPSTFATSNTFRNDPTVYRSSLHISAINGHCRTLQLLISKGVFVDERDSAGSTALHLASQIRSPEVAAVLIEAGADVDALDGNGWTPLHHAAESGNDVGLELLLRNGANAYLRARHRSY